MWNPLKTERTIQHSKPSIEHEQLGMRPPSWISFWIQNTRQQAHESIFDNGTEMLRSTRHEPVNALVMVSEGQFTWIKLHHKTCDNIWCWISPVWARLKGYWNAIEEYSRDDNGQAGFMSPVGKGPGKGGKSKWVWYNIGKGSVTKGKRTIHKGLGFQPERGE